MPFLSLRRGVPGCTGGSGKVLRRAKYQHRGFLRQRPRSVVSCTDPLQKAKTSDVIGLTHLVEAAAGLFAGCVSVLASMLISCGLSVSPCRQPPFMVFGFGYMICSKHSRFVIWWEPQPLCLCVAFLV